MKICFLLPYANPHVTGWINYYKLNTNDKVIIGISKSVKKFRNNYFIESDSLQEYLYLFKSKLNRETFIKEVKETDIFVTLGIFNFEFLRYILFCKRKTKLFIISESFNPIDSKKSNFIRKIYCYILCQIIPSKNIYFLAIGGKKVKDYYQRLGFSESTFHNFGYFPMLPLKNSLEDRLSSTTVKFLFVGQLIERKGISVLKELVKYLGGKYENWQMIIIGSGDRVDEIRLLTQKFPQVKYCGLVVDKDELMKYYQSANVLFLPSYFDGWGAVVNEAISFGCSLLLSKYVGASMFLLKDGKNGFLFDPYNIQSLFDKVDNYFKTKDLLDNHSRASFEIYAVWNHVNAAKKFKQLLEGVYIHDDNNTLLQLL